MNSLLKREQPFLRLFMTASNEQKKALVKTITTSQMRAVIQIVYNIILGSRNLSELNKKKVRRYKPIILRFIEKGKPLQIRRSILLKDLSIFVLLVQTVRDEL